MPAEGKYRGRKEFHLVYCEFIRAARYRGTITYQEVAEAMGITPTGGHMAKEVGRIADEISEDEHRAGRPMLSAILVHKGDGKPGKGFFDLAKDLGKLQEDSGEMKHRFWEEEKRAIYDFWKKDLKP
jgi:hypothetical protein